MEALGSAVMRPVLAGIQTNLYMVFMDTTWRNLKETGTVRLLHPGEPLHRPEGRSTTAGNVRATCAGTTNSCNEFVPLRGGRFRHWRFVGLHNLWIAPRPKVRFSR